MTEAEWLTSADPQPMLSALDGRVSDRKLRLWRCACVRRVRDLLGKACWKAVRAAEEWAEGLTDSAALDRAVRAARRELDAVRGVRRLWSAQAVPQVMASQAAVAAAQSDPDAVGPLEAAAAWAVHDLGDRLPDGVLRVTGVGPTGVRTWHRATARGPDKAEERASVRRLTELIQDGWWSERQVQADMLRCVCGMPGVELHPRYRTTDVLGLAGGIYEESAHDRLPLLADALMDAGCDDERLLAHCRSTGHVRGCWVVDLILDRE